MPRAFLTGLDDRLQGDGPPGHPRPPEGRLAPRVHTYVANCLDRSSPVSLASAAGLCETRVSGNRHRSRRRAVRTCRACWVSSSVGHRSRLSGANTPMRARGGPGQSFLGVRAGPAAETTHGSRRWRQRAKTRAVASLATSLASMELRHADLRRQSGLNAICSRRFNTCCNRTWWSSERKASSLLSQMIEMHPGPFSSRVHGHLPRHARSRRRLQAQMGSELSRFGQQFVQTQQGGACGHLSDLFVFLVDPLLSRRSGATTGFLILNVRSAWTCVCV